MNFMNGCEVWDDYRKCWLRESEYPQWAFYWASDEERKNELVKENETP